MKEGNILVQLLSWKDRHIQPKHFLLILSIIVGLLSGFAVVLIKNLVHLIKEVLTWGFVKEYENYLYFLYPFIGLSLAVISLSYIFKKVEGQGIPKVLYALAKKGGILRGYHILASILSSSLTVGFGGSVGLEGPTVATNSAIGSNVGRILGLDKKGIMLLLGCGVAGAMSGIFNAPIAALVFVLEVFMFDLSLTSMIPFLAASVTATLSSRMILGNSVLFNIDIIDPFINSQFPYYILLGVFTGLVSVFFNKSFWLIEGLFEKISKKKIKLLIGGIILGGLLFLVPPLYGEGFETISDLLSGNYQNITDHSLFFDHKNDILIVLGLLFGMIFLKVIATSVTISAGGIGGVFAPSLFVGATSGFVFAKTLNIFRDSSLSETNFTLVGMAGLIAGVLHAPLTSLFLIAEITKGYDLIIPLMITAAIAYLTSKYFVSHSIYAMQLAKRGELITRHKDKAVLTVMNLKKEIETNFISVSSNGNLGELIKVVEKSKRNLFPVVNEHNHLEGIISLDDIRSIMFKPELYENTLIKDLMKPPGTCIKLTDSMDNVMQKFTETNAWNLPVINDKTYIGFVSKSKLFNAYRKQLMYFSED